MKFANKNLDLKKKVWFKFKITNGLLESTIRLPFKKKINGEYPHKANHQANVICRIDLNSFSLRNFSTFKFQIQSCASPLTIIYYLAKSVKPRFD